MMKKNILRISAAAILLFITFFFNQIRYGLSLARGQLTILYRAEEISEVLKSSNLSEEARRKLLLIADVKKFAVENLAITDNGNYETYFNNEGKPLLWVVTACEPYSFNEQTWHFPLLGDLSYKGFFSFGDAKKEALKFSGKGMDVGIGKVSGWSTLGWLRDPVLASMLKKSDGQLVALIIHEMLHGTVYLGTDVDFSENLADFVGSEGARLFFQYKGLFKDLKAYEDELHTEREMNDYFLNGKEKLSKGYATFKNDSAKLKAFKQKTIRELYQGIFAKTLPIQEKSRYIRSAKYLYFEGNDYLMGFNRYGKLQHSLKAEFTLKFNKNLRKMIEFYKNKN